LVKRQNSQAGDSEVWVATADKVLSDARVHSTEAQPGFAQDLTVIALEGVSGIGAAAGSSGVSRAPDVALTTTRRTSVVFAVGNDPGHAEARTWPPGWVPLSQVLDTASGRSHWSQYTNDPTGPAGSFVAVRDTAPTKDGWNLVAVELVNEES
jgi:hypothetical protein